MNENELAKKVITVDRKDDEIKKPRKHTNKGRSQKEIDKELRKQYDKGKAYDEDEDDMADRKNETEQNEDDKFEAILRDYNN